MPQIDTPMDGRGAASEAQEAQPMDAEWRAVLCRESGVWHVEGPHACFAIRTELATVWSAGGGAEERARLVAAAPELLAALKHRIDQAEGALRYFEDHYPQDDFLRDTLLHGIEDARAAIARAEGR
jgi:hypothetical protein